MRAACSCAHLKKRAGARAGAWGARKPSRGQGASPAPKTGRDRPGTPQAAGRRRRLRQGPFPLPWCPPLRRNGHGPADGPADGWRRSGRFCGTGVPARKAAGGRQQRRSPHRDQGGPPAPAADRARDKKGRRPLRTTAPNLTGSAEAGNLVPSRSSFRLPGCVPAAR